METSSGLGKAQRTGSLWLLYDLRYFRSKVEEHARKRRTTSYYVRQHKSDL